MHLLARSLLAFGLGSSLVQAQPVAHNMTLDTRIPYPPCSTADVWMHRDYVLIARRWVGFSVVDMRVPTAPVERTIHPPGYPVRSGALGIGDVKADSRYYYVASDIQPGGVFVYDAAADPLNPTLVTLLADQRTLKGVHNCWVEGDTLYLACNRTSRIEVYDITNRAAPVWLSSLGDGVKPRVAHDVVVLGGRAYCSFAFDGFAIYDVTDPRLPVRLAHKTYADNLTHNLWPSEDGQFLFSTDENVVNGVGGHIRVWDIANLPRVDPVTEIALGARGSVVHNVHVRGPLLFAAYYREGLRVVDIQDPRNPVEIAHYDTYLPEGEGCFGGLPYAGAFGVYPWDLEHVFVTDIDSGGYFLRLNVVPSTLSVSLGGSHGPPDHGRVHFGFENVTPVSLPGFGLLLLAGANNVPIGFPVVADVRSLRPGEQVEHDIQIPGIGAVHGLQLQFAAFSGTFDPLLSAMPHFATLIVP